MTITRGKLAEQTGCHAETIRYYEKVGLLSEPDRSPAGYRIYSDEHVKQLKFILRSKALGFSAERIRSLVELSNTADNHTRAEVKSVTADHIEEISLKIKDLQKLKSQLSKLSAHCDGSSKSAESCPILISLLDE
ncbi:MAG: MerR family mercuric resistance operon transcriptional regulator [Saprospiraceae bacterium]|jgi:MerR family mercuric resistance operon transcriptional regulator